MRGPLVIAAALFLAWAGSGCSDSASNAAPPASPAERFATVTCEDAALGSGDPKWRRRSTAAGPFGFIGPGRNFKKMAWRNNKGFFISKVPSILEGKRAATVVVALRDADRAGLSYGTQGGHTLQASFNQVRYEPCLDDRRATGWPGGFVLVNRKPVKLLVQVEGAAAPIRITVGKAKRKRR